MYDGDIVIRKLEGVTFDNNDIKKLMEFRREVTSRPYEQDIIELIKAAYDGPFGLNTEDLSSLFCSELVAEAYQRLGLLDESIPSNEYTPRDFSEKGKLKLLKGRLSEEILLKDVEDV